MKRAFGVLLGISASAVLFLLAMPPADHAWLAWYAFVPVFVAVRGIGGGFGVLCGIGTCLLASWLCSLNLFYPPLVAEADNSWTFTGLTIFGLLVGVAGGIVGESKRLRGDRMFAFAAMMVLAESFSGFVLTANYGITQYRVEPLLRLASFGGLWSVSFLLWATNFALAAALSNRHYKSLIAFAVMASALCALALVHFPKSIGEFRVAALQGDLMNDEYKNLTSRESQVTVWPELSGMQFAPGGDTKLLREFAKKEGVTFVTSYEDDYRPKPHNTAAVFSPAGESARYWKRKPFAGEITIHEAGTAAASASGIGLNICFDSCYPSVIRDTARLPGVWLIALPTHDPASPNGFVQAAHAAYTPFRAAECGVSIIRADSSAYSMIVDAHGNIVAEMPAGKLGRLNGALSHASKPTLYRRFGDWFLWVCAAIVCATLLRRLGRRGATGPAQSHPPT